MSQELRIPWQTLRELRGWAEQRIRESDDPAWSRYQHMKLVEAIDAILSVESDAAAFSDRPTGRMRVDESDPRQSDWPVQVMS